MAFLSQNFMRDLKGNKYMKLCFFKYVFNFLVVSFLFTGFSTNYCCGDTPAVTKNFEKNENKENFFIIMSKAMGNIHVPQEENYCVLSKKDCLAFRALGMRVIPINRSFDNKLSGLDNPDETIESDEELDCRLKESFEKNK